jgi:hypothetical protein
MKKIIVSLFLFLSVLFLSSTTHAQTYSYTDSWGPAGFSLIEGEDGLGQINFSIQSFSMKENLINGLQMKNIQLPEVFLPGEAGSPDLPGIAKYFAIPKDSRASLRIVSSRTEMFENIEIAPAPRIPFETEDGPLEYTLNEEVYFNDEFYPQSPLTVSEPFKVRGVDVVLIGVTPFQYNPVTKELIVYRDLKISIDISNPSPSYGEQRLRSKWWDTILKDMLLNYSVLPEINYSKQIELQGYEYLIISPDNASYLAWADTIKNFRSRQGIKSTVVSLTTIGGNTYELIKAYIQNAYNTWQFPPSAVLILGDYSTAGATGNGVFSQKHNNYCVSDNMFVDFNNDHLPEIATSRIVAETPAQLPTIINKMINYEKNPPTLASYYDKPIMAGGWQTERWFILCTEVFYGYLKNVQQRNPVREYAIYSGTPGTAWSTNQNTNIVVNYFGPSGLQYIPATPQHLTDWAGNATRINNQLNSGSFLLFHRDHGSTTGWGEPSYNTSSLNSLNNDNLCFVYSLNCLTGKYNNTSETFTEKFIRHTKGAVGVIAASETSYSFVNDAFAWGMIDHAWTDFDPGYGVSRPHQMMPSFSLASGKYYLQASSWPYNTSSKTVTYHLFHHHGDAFQTIYTDIPQSLTVVHDSLMAHTQSLFTVTADSGSVICLSKNNEIISVADGIGTPVHMLVYDLNIGDLLDITITKQNYFRYENKVLVTEDGVPVELASFSAKSISNSVQLDWQTSTETNNMGFEIERKTNEINNSASFWVDGKGTTTEKQYYSFTDKNLLSGIYKYHLIQVDYDGTRKEVGAIEVEVNSIPTEFALMQNYPNPFNPETNINYQLPVNSFVTLKVFDILGNEVKSLINENQEAGSHSIKFDASELTSGIYIYKLITGNFSSAKKMLLLR